MSFDDETMARFRKGVAFIASDECIDKCIAAGIDTRSAYNDRGVGTKDNYVVWSGDFELASNIAPIVTRGGFAHTHLI